LPMMPKTELAQRLADIIVERYHAKDSDEDPGPPPG
jgi:hypothetical protein